MYSNVDNMSVFIVNYKEIQLYCIPKLQSKLIGLDYVPNKFTVLNELSIAFRTELRGGPAARGITGMIGNVVLVNSSFHTRKDFSENYLQFGHASSKCFASPVLGRKRLKNIGLEGRQIISLLRTPNY